MSDQPHYGAYPPAASPDLPTHEDGVPPTAGWGEPLIPTRAMQHAAKKRKSRLIAACVLALLLVAVAGYGVYSAISKPRPIEAAAEKCTTVAKPEDGGHTLTLRNVGAKEGPGPDSYTAAACVLLALETPSRVNDHIGQTRALDGTQTDTWEDFTARWTYHPDNGMTITITDSK
ncbi:hypothetical protein GCM10009868_40780 [Terrabacter aerolatus]|uniref:Uncharacterized protein n=1 Tax=Terrabacter aerolatus TaxID=422442 RepID=A0A512D6A4_9MICO|nr:hypothetical protein [Terrabacter aerolatus]GEO32011.1 hypothetical protein TAE01_38210 [Terrabacter aerolatus]